MKKSLQQHDTKLVYLIFDIQQCHVELYINPANHALGGGGGGESL